MRVGFVGLLAAIAVSAGVGAGITYAVAGGDDTKRELERAFDEIEADMDTAIEDFYAEPDYDRDAVQQEAFDTSASHMPDHLVLGICDAAATDGVDGVDEFLRSDEYVFELPDDMEFTTRAWVDYCYS